MSTAANDETRGLNADMALQRLVDTGREPVAFWMPTNGASVEAWATDPEDGHTFRKFWHGRTLAGAAQAALNEPARAGLSDEVDTPPSEAK